jgi:hypothetical protein
MALSPSNNRLLVSDVDCAISEFDLDPVLGDAKETAKSVRSLKRLRHFDGDGWHTSPVDTLAYLDEDTVGTYHSVYSFLVSKGCSDNIVVWDTKQSTEAEPYAVAVCEWSGSDGGYGMAGHVYRAKGNNAGSIIGMADGVDCPLLFQGCSDGTVCVYDFSAAMGSADFTDNQINTKELQTSSAVRWSLLKC